LDLANFLLVACCYQEPPSTCQFLAAPTFAHVPRRRTRVPRAPAQRRSQRQNRQFCGSFIL